MYAGLFDAGEEATQAIAPGRLAYVHLVRGTATVNGRALVAGDALLYRDEPQVRVEAGRGAEVLVFDLPDLWSGTEPGAGRGVGRGPLERRPRCLKTCGQACGQDRFRFLPAFSFPDTSG